MLLTLFLILLLVNSHPLRIKYREPHITDLKMSWLPFVVVQKPYKATRVRLSSLSSEASEDEYQSCRSSPCPSPSGSRDNSPTRAGLGDVIRLQDEISASGGFSHILSEGGLVKRQIFGFPTRPTSLSSADREQILREFVSKLYNLRGDNKEEQVDRILRKITPTKECKRKHLPEGIIARNLVNNVETLPSDGFVKPNPQLAVSTPGPRLAMVPNIFTPHTPTDSLKLITHIQLSDDDARLLRGYSIVGLASEYAVKQKRTELLGNQGQGWTKFEKLILTKWYRNEANEINNYVRGEPAKQEIVFGRIPKSDIITAVKHWASVLTSEGLYCDMQSWDFCPDILRDAVILVTGNDSGQGCTREGLVESRIVLCLVVKTVQHY